MYKFQTVYGSQEEKPKEIDTTSSRYVVYIRKDIEPYETEGDEFDPPFKGWKYQEMIVPNNEWIVAQLKEQKQSNEALMLGLCDLYEQNLGV